MRYINLLALILLLCRCNSHSAEDSNKTVEKNLFNNSVPDDNCSFLSVSSKIIITSYHLVNKPDSFDLKDCNSWNAPSKKELPFIFSKLKRISGEEVHGVFNYYGCAVGGEFTYQDTLYYFKLNAGGYLDLYRKNGNTIHFGAYDTILKKYFIQIKCEN